MNNFKPWAPPTRKPFLLYKPPNPSKVCVHVSANSQWWEISKSGPDTYSETPKLGTPSPQRSALHVSDPDQILCSDLQDDTDIPIEPPPFGEILRRMVYCLQVNLARTTV
ncbi:hypothetical protein BJX76DRAFT_344547 [Aspergillus varians]